MSPKGIDEDINFVQENVVENIGFAHILPSPIHGFGLFATENILPGQILGTLDGQVIDWDKYDEIVKALKSNVGNLNNFIFMEWNALSTSTLLVRPFRTKYSYINHSYKPNLKIEYNPIRIVALKKIEKGEEYTLDYTKEPLREEYLNGHGKTYL